MIPKKMSIVYLSYCFIDKKKYEGHYIAYRNSCCLLKILEDPANRCHLSICLTVLLIN